MKYFQTIALLFFFSVVALSQDFNEIESLPGLKKESLEFKIHTYTNIAEFNFESMHPGILTDISGLQSLNFSSDPTCRLDSSVRNGNYYYVEKYDYDSNDVLTTKTNYEEDFKTGIIIPYFKYEYLFDSMGNITKQFGYYKQRKQTEWTFSYGIEQQFNTQGLLTSLISYQLRDSIGISPITKDLTQYDSVGNIILEEPYWYDYIKNIWIGYNQSFSYYHTYDSLSRKLTTTAALWNENTLSWELDNKEDYKYDINGQLINLTSSTWNKGTSSWIFESMEEHYHSADSNSVLFKDWDRLTHNWLNTDLDVTLLDYRGNQLYEAYYEWNDMDNAWSLRFTSMQNKYIYNSNQNPIQFIFNDSLLSSIITTNEASGIIDSIGNTMDYTKYRWRKNGENKDSWVPESKYISTKHSDGATSEISLNWNQKSEKWDEWRYTKRDSLDRVTISMFHGIATIKRATYHHFHVTQKEKYHYNSDGQLTDYLGQLLTLKNKWFTLKGTQNIYDTQGTLTKNISGKYVAYQQQYVIEPTKFYYSCNNDNTKAALQAESNSIPNEQLKSNNTFTIYPNPAYKYFQFRLNEIYSEEPITLFIYNIHGNIVLEKHNVLEATEVDIRGIATGNYWIRIMDVDGKSETHKLVIK